MRFFYRLWLKFIEIFYIGRVKDRNAMDLTEAEDIKMRWQEYTQMFLQKRS